MLKEIALVLVAALSIVPVSTLCLAALTYLHQKIRRSDMNSIYTALFCGRVSHTRYQPIRHAFAYPLFYCLLDLSEVQLLFKGRRGSSSIGSGIGSSLPLLWPLTYFMTFREEDHLKNGEGLEEGPSGPQNDNDGDELGPRIRKLVSERTNGKFTPSKDAKILLLTHLSYYGYCFNPVSFYYILKPEENDGQNDDDSSMKIEAIVAEVSNTPWLEMLCYVLHPDSVDISLVQDGRTRKHAQQVTDWNKSDSTADTDEDASSNSNSSKNYWKSVNYIFNKEFHVSPFMEMNYIYDWTFWDMTHERVMASASMIKREKNGDGDEDTNENKKKNSGAKCFNAFFDISRTPFTPFQLCYQLVKFPVYCMIIQIWIHYEAVRLLVKGVQFIPHPDGSETAASAAIAHVMAPFFAFKSWLSQTKSKSDDGNVNLNPDVNKAKAGKTD